MKTSTWPFIFLFFFFFASGQTNKKVDSLLAIYNSLPDNERKIRILSNLYDETEYADPDLAKTYVDMELKLAEKLKNIKEIGSAYYNLACYHYNGDRIDSVKHYLNKTLEKYEASNHEQGKLKVLFFKAILDYDNGNYDQALEKVEKIITLEEKRKKDYGSLASDYSFRGLLYENKGYYKLALESHLKGLRIIDTNKVDGFTKAQALSHIASIEDVLKNIPKAIEYTEQALEIYDQLGYIELQAEEKIDLVYYFNTLEEYGKAIKTGEEAIDMAKRVGSETKVHDAYAILGASYIKLGEFSKGIQYLNKSLIYRREFNELPDVLHSLHSLGIAYTEMNRPDEALAYFKEAFLIADSIKDPKWFRRLFKDRSDAYQKKNIFKNALEDYKKAITIKDSLAEISKNREIEELRTIYDTEKKEQQIVLQEKEITVLEQQAEISNLQKILLGGGLVLSLIGFYGIRQKLKRNKLEKEKVDAELAFKKKELTTHALHLAKKNEVLESLKQKAEELKTQDGSTNGYQQLIRTINFDLQDDNNWKNFSRYFEEVHKDFNINVKSKYPQVTSNELRLLALLKMNLSSKEIANILNISPEGIKKARYRLRKKLDITTEESLQDLVLSL